MVSEISELISRVFYEPRIVRARNGFQLIRIAVRLRPARPLPRLACGRTMKWTAAPSRRGPAPDGRKGMKKDIADEFERELMQPLAEALRTRLGDAADVQVNNEPRLTDDRVDYATWLEVRLNEARTEVIFRPLDREDFSAVWQWGKNGRFIFPIPQVDGDAGDSARASIDAVAERIRKTASMWHEEPPESFGWSVT
jgi:hypothetical protein